MKKLVLGLALAFAANAALAMVYYNVQIDELWYHLDDSTKTAEVAFHGYSMTSVEIPESVTYDSQEYAVTSIGGDAFNNCTSLESVSAPSVTSIGQAAFANCTSLESVYAPFLTSIGLDAFGGCSSLTSLTVNPAMKKDWLSKALDYYGVHLRCNVIFYTPPPPTTVTMKPSPADNSSAKVYTNGVEVTNNPIVVLSNATVAVVFTTDGDYCFANDHSTARTNTVEATTDPTEVVGPEVVKIPSLSEEDTQQAWWKTETTVTVSTALKSGDTMLDKTEYENACLYYGIEAKAKPTAEDYKVVSKDAQVVQEGEIAVKEAELQAAKAEAVSIEGGVVTLAVGVNSNANFTAETKTWAPVELKSENVEVKDGKIVISIPVGDKSGFMILQSGDANVPAERLDSRWGVLLVD